MECFPVCSPCTGFCNRLMERPVKQARKAVRKAKKTAAPRKMPGYIVMICGHYTTVEVQVIQFTMNGKRFPSSLTGKTKFYCSKCDRWIKPYTFSDRIQDMNDQLPF